MMLFGKDSLAAHRLVPDCDADVLLDKNNGFRKVLNSMSEPMTGLIGLDMLGLQQTYPSAGAGATVSVSVEEPGENATKTHFSANQDQEKGEAMRKDPAILACHAYASDDETSDMLAQSDGFDPWTIWKATGTCHRTESHPSAIERKSALTETKESDNETAHPHSKDPDAAATVAVPEVPHSHQHADEPLAKAAPDAGATVSVPEPACAHQAEHDAGATVSAPEPAGKQKQRKGEVVTKERLRDMHILSKHLLTLNQLRNLLTRAKVSNVTEALDHYKAILASCDCRLSEYLHRHRLPRLQLEAIAPGAEVWMNLFWFFDFWRLIVVDVGSR